MTNDANPALSASASTAVYQMITLNIVANNSQVGQRIAIVLSGRGHSQISWSAGPEFSRSAEIQLRGSGAVSGFSVGSEMITLQLGPSETGGAASFTLALYLVAAPSIAQFTLQMSANAGGSVSATLPRRDPVPLGGSPIIFDWNPY